MHPGIGASAFGFAILLAWIVQTVRQPLVRGRYVDFIPYIDDEGDELYHPVVQYKFRGRTYRCEQTWGQSWRTQARVWVCVDHDSPPKGQVVLLVVPLLSLAFGIGGLATWYFGS